jgi:hypothetical protein
VIFLNILISFVIKEKMMKYEFPVKNKFHARSVTELDFEIDSADSDIYVNLDAVRGKDHIEEIQFNLNVDEDSLQVTTDHFIKIIFSGHRGSGKTVELQRFQKYIDDPARYFSVFIRIEKELEVGSFQPEDLFIILMVKLIAKIHEARIEFDSGYIKEIQREWLSETTVLKELKDNFQIDVSSEVAAGASFFVFLKLKSALKAVFSSESKTLKTIRETIKKNPKYLIDKFNAVLADLRTALTANHQSKDILFILDGTEKIPYQIYRELFCENSYLIRAINANMIFSVPINAYFDIKGNPAAEFFQTYTLPMIAITPGSMPLLKQIVTKRIDAETFLEDAALDFCIQKSGGCIRQLLRIVNKALIISRGMKITKAAAEKSVNELGRSMIEQFDSEHLSILKQKQYHTADLKVLDLLFSLAVLKYNGDREINPLIKEYLDE